MLPDYSTFSISTNRRAEGKSCENAHYWYSDGIRVDGYCLLVEVFLFPYLFFRVDNSVQHCIVYFDMKKSLLMKGFDVLLLSSNNS